MQLNSGHGVASAGASPVGWIASVAAAASLVLPQAAEAQGLLAPLEPEVSWRWMDYQEQQGQDDRMRVIARSVHLKAPVGEQWSIEGYTVVDAISGASPYFYATPSSFVDVDDKRHATDFRLSYHQPRQRWTVGGSRSSEVDYDSQAVMLQWSVADELQNLVLDLGFAATRDRINPVNKRVMDARKQVDDWLVGLTWVATPVDVFQAQVSRSEGRGYYSDPYKFLDQRPDGRRVMAYQLRWNHHRPQTHASWRSVARHLRDDWGVRTWTGQVERASRLGAWRLTPAVRYHAQSAARFFLPPDPAQPEVPHFGSGFAWGKSLSSFDQRLSGFGALTVSIKLDYLLSSKAEIHLKLDRYRQRAAWAGPFRGTVGIPDFSATTVQLGWTYRFGT